MIIKRMHGKLDVDSVRGQGTTVRVSSFSSCLRILFESLSHSMHRSLFLSISSLLLPTLIMTQNHIFRLAPLFRRELWTEQQVNSKFDPSPQNYATSSLRALDIYCKLQPKKNLSSTSEMRSRPHRRLYRVAWVEFRRVRTGKEARESWEKRQIRVI